jgi:hypothetical protein
MFPEVIYSWLLGISAIAGTAILVVLIVFWIILGIKIFFD